MTEPPWTDQNSVDPDAIPFGFTFGVDTDGSPTARNREGHEDTFTNWLEENPYPSEIAQHLAGIDDVIAGRRASYLGSSNALEILVEPSGFQLRWMINLPKNPHYVGSVPRLRLLLERWVAHMQEIGWTEDLDQ